MNPMRTDTTLTAEALLFDMDGTLVDSTVVVERTWRRFARRHGLDAAEILATAHGRRTEETVALYAPEGTDTVAESARLVREEIEDVEGIVAVPGARDVLAALPADRWAVVTSAGRELALRRMAAAGLEPPRLLVTADDVAAGKPDPEGYLKAAAALGLSPAAAVVFEDAEAGVAAALAAGTTAVVVGDHTGPFLRGLPRVRDFRDVAVAIGADGSPRLTLRPTTAVRA